MSDVVISLKDFKDRKATSNSKMIIPLSDAISRPKAEDFADRMQRIKTSLEKINRLMGDLKGNSPEGDR